MGMIYDRQATPPRIKDYALLPQIKKIEQTVTVNDESQQSKQLEIMPHIFIIIINACLWTRQT